MTTSALSALLTADPAAVLEHDKMIYQQQIVHAADVIAANAAQRPVVLLAGPSGSGKTTTALLIERELDRRGMETHTVSMDNYFSPLTAEELELMRHNALDLEKPTRVDIPFFQQQLGQILRGEEIALPRYDFENSRRVFDGRTLRRRPGELIIMEGIHALNPEVTGHDAATTRIYVSVRTRITAQSGRVLHPSKIRLLRRMLRDKLSRGRAFCQTVGNCERVDHGEQAYIMPFNPRAHCSIDSFYSSELSVYRACLTAAGESLDGLRLEDLTEILSELPEVDPALVPEDSLLREFIGGSILDY